MISLNLNVRCNLSLIRANLGFWRTRKATTTSTSACSTHWKVREDSGGLDLYRFLSMNELVTDLRV